MLGKVKASGNLRPIKIRRWFMKERMERMDGWRYSVHLDAVT